MRPHDKIVLSSLISLSVLLILYQAILGSINPLNILTLNNILLKIGLGGYSIIVFMGLIAAFLGYAIDGDLRCRAVPPTPCRDAFMRDSYWDIRLGNAKICPDCRRRGKITLIHGHCLELNGCDECKNSISAWQDDDYLRFFRKNEWR